MPTPTLIIVTGLPATGKTTIATTISHRLAIPLFCKDDIKEILFDQLGPGDRARSRELGKSSVELLYYSAEILLKAGKSVMIEANFNPTFATKALLELKEKYSPEIIQIRCFAQGEIVFERFKARALSGDRHAGHMDNGNLEELKPLLLQEKIEAVDVGGRFIDVDTTDFEKIDYDGIVRIILESHGQGK